MGASRRTRSLVTVALLFLVNLVNYIDRFSVPGVLPDISAEFNLEPWQGGLIQTSFVIFFCLSAPVCGYLGDRFSRKWLIVGGATTWASVSFASTFMKSFIPFLVLRAAIGFGEAAVTTLGPTILGDLFADEDRSVVLAVYYFAVPLGSGLGYMVGSSVAGALGDWRWGLRVAPLLVVVTIILMIFFLENPKRGASDHYDGQERAGMTLADIGDDLRYFLHNKSFILTTAGFTCFSFFSGGVSWWAPTVFENAIRLQQEYGLEPNVPVDKASFIFGLSLSAAGVVGLPLGAFLSYKLRPKISWIDPIICGGCLLASWPICIAGVFVLKSDIVLSIVLVFFGMMLLNMDWSIIVDILLYVVIPTHRSTGEALQMMFAHGVGEAGSPYLIGLLAGLVQEDLSDFNTSNPNAVNASSPMSPLEKEYYSFEWAFFLPLMAEAIGGICFLWAAAFVTADKKKAEEHYHRIDQYGEHHEGSGDKDRLLAKDVFVEDYESPDSD